MCKRLKTYTFKAECLSDVTNLLKNLTQKHKVARAAISFQEHCGDVQVVLTTEAKTNQVKAVMRQQPDSHVMARTLKKAY